MACLQFSLLPKCLQSFFPAGDDLSFWDTTADSTPSNDMGQNALKSIAQPRLIQSIKTGFVSFLAAFFTTNIKTTDPEPEVDSCKTRLFWWPSCFE